MGRYKGVKRFNNSEKYYEYLRKKRNLKVARHYETPILKNPSVQERMGIAADTHVWSLGDRYYKLAHKYYGDETFWWVIAWYNAVPIESDLSFGDLIEIPVNLASVLDILGLNY
tara:strand:- start:3840 stop:4181 length:342 start_codon:yes stop_codon:yes gene_type:complete